VTEPPRPRETLDGEGRVLTFVLQLAESDLTRHHSGQTLGRIERLAGHPTWARASPPRARADRDAPHGMGGMTTPEATGRIGPRGRQDGCGLARWEAADELADGTGDSVDAVTGRQSLHIRNPDLDGLDDYRRI
jgi:hypothetical protein